MLYKNKNSKWSLGKYAAVALLIGFASLVVASCERDALPSTKGESGKQTYELVDVQGIIKGEDGKPLPGASIEVKGGTRGTTTDLEGKFRLTAPAGSKLEVKFEDLQSIALAIGPNYKSTNFLIRLTPNTATSEEPIAPHVAAAPSGNGKSVNLTVQPSTINGEPIFTVVEQQPEFMGGIQALSRFLEKNLQYPAAARRARVQGKVFLNFVVTKEGEIKDVTILKGMGFGLDEEALRIMSQMPRWAPGRQDGKPLNVRYNLPIAFDLDKKPELKTGKESKKEGKS